MDFKDTELFKVYLILFFKNIVGSMFHIFTPVYLYVNGFPILNIGLFFIMSSRGRRKQEAKRREMIASLKKGDKVTSIGGIVGTVVETRDDEIAVKVDESVRKRFARWAIRGVGEQAKTESPEEKK